MLKKFSVIILAVFQLIFCISLALYNPTIDRLIENSDEVYNLKINYIAYENYDSNVEIFYCFDADWQDLNDYMSNDIYNNEYGIIKTDKNGISHLASISPQKPKDTSFVKGPFGVHHHSWHYEFSLDEAMIAKLDKLGIYQHNFYSGYTEYDGGHDITATVRVYKGYYNIEDIRIDGVPLEYVLREN